MSLLSIIAQMSGSAGVTPPPPTYDLTNANIIMDGNSYASGFGTRLLSFAPFDTNGATMVNTGVSGQTTLQMLSDEATEIYPLFDPAVLNILIVQEGGNDLYFTYTSPTAVADAVDHLKTYVSNARTYCSGIGAQLLVVFPDLIPRDNTELADVVAYNQSLVDFNAAVDADNSWIDLYIKPSLESIFATYTSGGYNVDHVHPSNTTGHDKYAQMIADGLVALAV